MVVPFEQLKCGAAGMKIFFLTAADCPGTCSARPRRKRRMSSRFRLVPQPHQVGGILAYALTCDNPESSSGLRSLCDAEHTLNHRPDL